MKYLSILFFMLLLSCSNDGQNEIKTGQIYTEYIQCKSNWEDHLKGPVKKVIPWLALSYYNLIPSCPHCNLIKLAYDLKVSPYDIDRNEVDDFIHFDYRFNGADYMRDHSQIEVTITEEGLEPNEEADSYTKVFALKRHYQTHKDYVQELLKKKELYNEHYLNELYINTGDLFTSKEELHKTLWGNYTKKEELHRRPLAKLTRDILKDMSLDQLEDE